MNRILVAMAYRGVNAEALTERVGPLPDGVQRLHRHFSPIEPERLAALQRGETPTQPEASALGVALNYPWSFFLLPSPTTSKTFLCGPSCACGEPADIACDYPVAGGTCDERCCSGCTSVAGDDLHYCRAHAAGSVA